MELGKGYRWMDEGSSYESKRGKAGGSIILDGRFLDCRLQDGRQARRKWQEVVRCGVPGLKPGIYG